MNIITTYTHTFNEDGDITARQPNAIYHLPDGCASYLDVPVGDTFVKVSPDTGEATMFEVIWYQVPRVDKEACRYYRPMKG